jgi:phosphoribosylaminoimidazolecarboxamide formyltransferase/IMP cyclohydrolase
MSIKTALISVSDKKGLDTLAKTLSEKNITIYSTGGTAKYLEKEVGVKVTTVESLTGFPEIMDGRVKTLHPKIFSGILARRDNPSDIKTLQDHQIPLIDLVVVNLYPFEQNLHRSPLEQIEYVDIGGPSLLRASAKNHLFVTVLSDPQDYEGFLDEFEKHKGKTSEDFRKQLATRTFIRTAHYDQVIAGAWSENTFPSSINLSPQTPLRYGENPHQKAAWCGKAHWKLLQGKELSYNNLLDAESACRLTDEFSDSAVVIVKHNNPCGASTGNFPQKTLFQRAWDCDPKSAFGGVLSFNRALEKETAELFKDFFLEVIVAPSFSEGALSVLKTKKNLRLVERPAPSYLPYDFRQALGGILVQESDRVGNIPEIKTVTQTPIPKKAEADLIFAWKVVKHTRSNAIVIARDLTTVGIGAGQTSRIDAVENALQKGSKKLESTVLASEAFFPFRDNIDCLKGLGISAVIQPGGSIKDSEVISACNELGIAMVFTGVRHFKH